jgi:hypothetical protein
MILTGNVFQDTASAYSRGRDLPCTERVFYEVEMKEF